MLLLSASHAWGRHGETSPLAAGRLGGFVGVFLFPILLAWNGLLAAESAAAAVSILGLAVTRLSR